MSGEATMQDYEAAMQEVVASEVYYNTTPSMAQEEAEALLQSTLDDPTPIETFVIPMNKTFGVPTNKVLLDLTAGTEFALHIGGMDHPLQSRYDDATGMHVINLGIPRVFALYSDLKCISNQDDDNIDNMVALRFKAASFDDTQALLHSNYYFVWKQDGMYLASRSGIMGSLFNPAVPSRDYSREEIANLGHLKNHHVVFFKFDDVASA